MKAIKTILEIFGIEWFKEDLHCHIFEKDHLPDDMIPYVPAWLENKIKDRRYIRIFLRLLNPFKSNTQLDWYANFLYVADKGYNAQFRLYKEQMTKHFPSTKSVTILTVDFEYMGAGKCKKGLEDQLEKAILIRNSHPKGDVKVYMGIDPRRPKLKEFIHDYIRDIDGFKMYLYNGFFPYDERLDFVYDVAESFDLEVVYHCSDTNINYYRGKDIKHLLNQSKFTLLPNRSGNKELSTNFCNSLGVRLVAQLHPSVRFRIAHFGGDEFIKSYQNGEVWDNYASTIVDALLFDKNITTDISFICTGEESVEFIKQITTQYPLIIPKIKFGLDWYMNETGGGIEKAAKLLC